MVATSSSLEKENVMPSRLFLPSFLTGSSRRGAMKFMWTQEIINFMFYLILVQAICC